jgi:hypothetical protein
MEYFNALEVDLNDNAYFSPEISERTKENPNQHLTLSCQPSDDSLDEYAKNLVKEMFAAFQSRV